MNLSFISKAFLLLIIFSAVLVVFFSLDKFQGSSGKEQALMQESINRALVQCYALEGSFPEDIYYLERYGVAFNTDKYIYYYEPMGDLIPVVKIISMEGGDEGEV
jgi:hypothetical protein